VLKNFGIGAIANFLTWIQLQIISYLDIYFILIFSSIF